MSLKQSNHRIHLIGAYLSPHNNDENKKAKILIKDHIIRIRNTFQRDEIIIAGDWNLIHIEEMNELADLANLKKTVQEKGIPTYQNGHILDEIYSSLKLLSIDVEPNNISDHHTIIT
jgi:hypothetical protein